MAINFDLRAGRESRAGRQLTPCRIFVNWDHLKYFRLAKLLPIFVAANCILFWASVAQAQSPASTLGPAEAKIIALEVAEEIETLRGGSKVWDRAYTNQVIYPGDELRTGLRSRAILQFSDQTLAPIPPRSHMRLQPSEGKRRVMELIKGVIYFFHRDKPGDVEVRTRLVNAVVLGTEFTLAVADDGTTTLSLIDGKVEMSNALGTLQLVSGQQGTVEPGAAPKRTAMLSVTNIIQWCMYYPAIINVDELKLPGDVQRDLADSLKAYHDGDLLAALAKYPAQRAAAVPEEQIYHAALLLSVGDLEVAEPILNRTLSSANADARLAEVAEALDVMIASVKGQAFSPKHSPKLASSYLALSYYEQSEGRLESALVAARKATALAPDFSFASVRVAELEFSFGRSASAREVVTKSLAIAPRNAQAHALLGYLLAAENKTSEALLSFDHAIALDPALGNAWLGRGLCKIKQGHLVEGQRDLLVAASAEPQRSTLRSYLGKAYAETSDFIHAEHELLLAEKLDARDPTPALYLALLRQQQNRINEGIRELERSQALNGNRQLYRSKLLLDQDRAVRGVNLANLYEDAGLRDASYREAVRSVDSDYGNFSSHWFLANTYNNLRDPRQINLRYETPWLSEYLVANLLSPVGAGTLSPFVTQQEYSRLFDRNRIGFSSATEYLSRGDWLQTAVQHGNYENFSYAAEVAYRSENGQRPNNDQEQLTATLKLKQQITAQDAIFFQGTYYKADAGDLRPLYDPATADTGLRVRERQEPVALLGYHHQWQPGMDTLFLAGRLNGTLQVTNPSQGVLFLHTTNGAPADIFPAAPGQIAQDYRLGTDIYTAELQQLFQLPSQMFIVGGRYQNGRFNTRNQSFASDNSVFAANLFDLHTQQLNGGFNRESFYGYYHWQFFEPLVVIAGVSYDRVAIPENFRFAPLLPGQKNVQQVSPKAGVIWTPLSNTTFRAAYSQSLGGAAFDQSFQLEPSQVAGFNQAWRSIIPESVAGANAGAKFETAGVALDQKWPSHTYAGLTLQWLRSRADRQVGIWSLNEPLFNFVQAQTPQRLDYNEHSVSVALQQLIGDDWSVGARYQLTHSALRQAFSDIPSAAGVNSQFDPNPKWHATLNELDLFTIVNLSCGFFAQADALWYAQANHGYSPALPGDDFWQFNLLAGYRMFQRHAEVRFGVLNLASQDYHLNPLNITTELPRRRTFVTSLRFYF